MRSQGCTIQQALTLEAITVVKQAVVLAKRRGHAQVTPLHVAHTMLSISSGLLRASCVQAHSHPFQCRALELCFNVALNRLPTSASSGTMMLGGPHHHHHAPTLANALVAAFKRAQAHQRRGSIENQQQPLLAVKIELDQLIISILDDPSVSRVMREAGFSSTLVKSKVELAINSMENNNQAPNNIKTKDNIIDNQSQGLTKMGKLEPRPLDRGQVRNEDVIECLMSTRKKNCVVVGECIEILEGIVREVMENDNLKGIKFFQFFLSSFSHLSREEVEQRVEEIKCLVKNSCGEGNKGMVLYLGDLKSATNNEFSVNRTTNGENYDNILVEQYQPRRRSCYCPIEHIIVEIERLVLWYGGEIGRLSLLGIATYQTYMRCKNGDPSLETTLSLHCITIPSQNRLSLSLLSDSDLHNHSIASKKVEIGGNWLMLNRGGVESETQSHKISGFNSESTTSSLPPWLQQCKDENSRKASNDNFHNDKDNLLINDLTTRWSSIRTSSPHISHSPSSSSFERTLSFSSISPSSSTSNFSYEHSYSKSHPTHQSFEPTFTLCIQDHKDDHNPHEHQRNYRTFVSSNPNSTPTSTSSSEFMDQMELSPCVTPRFKEYNAENLKTICNALEQKVPHQKEVIFDIASTLLKCRAGMTRRKLGFQEREIKEETWLFFQGVDIDAKEKLARELARINFGSEDKFVSLGLSSFSSTRADSSEDSRNKRIRDEQSYTYIERFAREVSRNPRRVFFVEDIEQVDYLSQMGIKKAIEQGRIYANGEAVGFGDAIIILSCERFRSKSRACSPSTKDKPQEFDQSAPLEDTISPSISLDLNLSINDDNDDNVNELERKSVDEIGLLALVDRCIMFESRQDRLVMDQ